MVQERVHQAAVRAESEASFIARMQEYCMDAAEYISNPNYTHAYGQQYAQTQEHALVAFATVPLDAMSEVAQPAQSGEWRDTGDDDGKSDEQDWHKTSMKIILDEALKRMIWKMQKTTRP